MRDRIGQINELLDFSFDDKQFSQVSKKVSKLMTTVHDTIKIEYPQMPAAFVKPPGFLKYHIKRFMRSFDLMELIRKLFRVKPPHR